MSLIRAERRRLIKRRFTKLMLAVVATVLATVVIAIAYQSHKIGAADRAAAQVQADREFEQWTAQAERDRANCRAEQQTGATNGRFPPGMSCDDIRGPRREEVDVKWFLPYQFNFRKEFGNLLMIFSGLLALFAFVVGASFVGAEWHSGGMMNLLLWRPRRVPVLLTKLGALLGGVLVLGLGLGTLWTAAFWVIGQVDGVTDPMTSGAWQSLALDGARGIGFALALGVVGFGLASIGRHTAMALGAAVGVVVVGEIGLRIALTLMRIGFPDRYMLSTYAMAWFSKAVTLEDSSGCDWSLGQCAPKQLLLTWQDSALVFGIGVAAVLALSLWAIRRRDVA